MQPKNNNGKLSAVQLVLKDDTWERKLRSFLEIPDGPKVTLSRSRWFHTKYFQVYIRSTRRMDLNCVDIANVEVYPLYRGQGVFTLILSIIESLALKQGYHLIYVENIHTNRFKDFFTNKFWKEDPYSFRTTLLPISFQKRLQQQQQQQPQPPKGEADGEK